MTDPTPATTESDPTPAATESDNATDSFMDTVHETEEKVVGFFERLDADAHKWFQEVARLLGHPLPSSKQD